MHQLTRQTLEGQHNATLKVTMSVKQGKALHFYSKQKREQMHMYIVKITVLEGMTLCSLID